MHSAPLPRNEDERLEALFAYDVLDSEAEPHIRDLISLAAAQFRVPIATISLIDRDRQWFLAPVGLDTCETSRDVAFCAHAILGTEILEVPNATEDKRFADNPLVLGPPGIRFYAGAPIRDSNDHPIGTFCLIDTVPRSLSAEDRAHLKMFAGIAMRQLENRKALFELASAGRELKHSRDVLRELHAELTQANLRANVASEAKDQFLRNMTHEMRTPLNAIIGATQLITSHSSFNSFLRSHTNIITDNAQNLLEMITRVINIARTEAGTPELSQDIVHTESFLRECAAPFLAASERANIYFDFSIASDLPESIRIDAEKTATVIRSLLDNAVKFTDSGGVVFRVRFAHRDLHHTLEIVVEDTGPGIPESERESLFAPFAQGTIGTESRGGAGLGLALSHAYANLMGASITLLNKNGGGCIFRFELPITIAAHDGNAPAYQSKPGPGGDLPSDTLSGEALEAAFRTLPESLRERIEEAAISCSLVKLGPLFVDADAVAPGLGARMKALATSYAFEELAELAARKD